MTMVPWYKCPSSVSWARVWTEFFNWHCQERTTLGYVLSFSCWVPEQFICPVFVLPLIAYSSESLCILLLLDLTLAVPVANSLTFVATALCGWAVGEEPPCRSKWKCILFEAYGAIISLLSEFLTFSMMFHESHTPEFTLRLITSPSRHEQYQSGGS
jgi:hypothetical protein